MLKNNKSMISGTYQNLPAVPRVFFFVIFSQRHFNKEKKIGVSMSFRDNFMY